MKTDFTLLLSSSNLWRRKLRSFLTVGGLAIGVSLIVFLVTLGLGLQKIIRAQITNVEALTVLDVSRGSSALLELNQTTVESFQQLNGVQQVSPSMSLSGQLIQKESATDVAVYGIAPEFVQLEGVKLSSGKNFSAENAKEIIATTTALQLIGIDPTEKAIGQELTVRVMVPKTVEGQTEAVMTPTDVTATISGIITDQQLTLVYMPLMTLEELGVPASYADAKVKVTGPANTKFTLARVKVTDQSQVPAVKKQIQNMGYQVDSVADTVDQVDRIFLIFQIIVAVLGSIAMFVAALGSLNTLTVSLLERTREFGLLKALGATSGDIYRLVLVESILMGIIGSGIGIGLGMGVAAGINSAMRYFASRLGGQAVDLFYTPWWFVVGLVGVVLMISIVTGYYPARRAVKISVLSALHHE